MNNYHITFYCCWWHGELLLLSIVNNVLNIPHRKKWRNRKLSDSDDTTNWQRRTMCYAKNNAVQTHLEWAHMLYCRIAASPLRRLWLLPGNDSCYHSNYLVSSILRPEPRILRRSEHLPSEPQPRSWILARSNDDISISQPQTSCLKKKYIFSVSHDTLFFFQGHCSTLHSLVQSSFSCIILA
jgi:hypothetical protein